jgi:hypothetical protein
MNESYLWSHAIKGRVCSLWHITHQCTIQKVEPWIFLDRMKPNPTDCPLGWVSVFFLFVPPHPWPATVSSKNNPDTYPFPATYLPPATCRLPATYPNSKPKPKAPPWFQSFSATVEPSSHSLKLYCTPKVLSHSITSATFLQSFAIAIAITRGEKVKKK